MSRLPRSAPIFTAASRAGAASAKGKPIMAADEAMRSIREHFSDPDFVARYAEGPPRFVPGFSDLHRMTGQLLAERAPEDARILVLGAGGGLEMKALADAYPGWHFVGVDPAPEMLTLARETLGPHAARATLVE